MSRKDFQVIATMLGDMGKQMGDGTFSDTMKVAVRHLKETNPAFKEDVFVQWASDVRHNKRDIDGKKVA
jgi:hypothetical protein